MIERKTAGLFCSVLAAGVICSASAAFGGGAGEKEAAMAVKKRDNGVKFLEKLVNTPTPTGSEAAGAMLLGRRIREKTGIRPSIDIHGNLHAVIDVGAKTTVMLEGHGDEIGYIVEYIDADGFVYLQALGGVVVPLSAAERVVIYTKNGPVNGVIGTRPPHLMNAEEKKKIAAGELRRMPCDIGASSKAEAEALVSLGDAALADTGWRPLAGTRVSGRGMDNRCGTYAMCEAFINLAARRKELKVNVHYVSSVSEEIGLVGGRLASYSVNPEIGISCDVAFAGDAQKDDAKAIGDIRLGKGVALAVGPIYHKGLVELARNVASDRKIPVQTRVVPKGSGNNAWALKMERGGAAVIQLGIPLRYMHSPVEVIDLKDVNAVIDMTEEIVLRLSDEFDLLPPQP